MGDKNVFERALSEEDVLSLIRHIDSVVLDVVRQVIRTPRFRRLEACYRNLWLLCLQVEGKEMQHEAGISQAVTVGSGKSAVVRLFCMPITAAELAKDVHVAELTASVFYKLLYSQRLDRLAAMRGVVQQDASVHPFGLMVLDFELAVKRQESADDSVISLKTLGGLAEIAEQAFCPIVLGLSPQFFRRQHDFRDLAMLDIESVFSETRSREAKEWLAFRQRSCARMISVAFPRVRLRPPYRREPIPALGVGFDERLDSRQEKQVGVSDAPKQQPLEGVWGNAAYAVAGLFVRSFRGTRWFMDATGVDRDLTRVPHGAVSVPSLGGGERGFTRGIVGGLPVGSFTTESRKSVRVSPLEVMISDQLQAKLAEFGLTALHAARLSGRVAMLSCPSLWDPRLQKDEVQQSVSLAAFFPYILIVARMVNLLRHVCWRQLGKRSTAEEVEQVFATWLSGKTTDSSNDLSDRLKKPLSINGTSVSVAANERMPGTYSCELKLCPHHRFSSGRMELSLEPIVINLPIPRMS